MHMMQFNHRSNWVKTFVLGLFQMLLSATLILSPASAAGEQEPQAKINVDVGKIITNVDPLLLGQNIYAVSNAAGMWNTKTNNLEPEVESLLKAALPTIMRFPGGAEADKYVWEDGIGCRISLDVKPGASSIMLNTIPNWKTGKKARFIDDKAGAFGDNFSFSRAMGGMLEGVTGVDTLHSAGTEVRLESREGQVEGTFNNFGTDELMKMLDLLGAKGIITVNYGTGVDNTGKVTPSVSVSQKIYRAVAWVAYFNGRPGDARPIGIDGEGNNWKTIGYWAQLRALRGRPNPYEIKHWEIGNETYGDWEPGFTTVRKYASDFVQFAKAMKAVDPSIKIGAVGLAHPHGPRGRGDADKEDEWNKTLIEAAGDSIDFVVLHAYYPTAKPDKYSYKSPEWFTATMAASRQAMAHIREIRSIINAGSRKGGEIQLAIDEYGICPFKSKDPRDYSNLAGAIFNSDFLVSLILSSKELGIVMANAWDLHSLDELASIHYNWSTGKRKVRPQYYAFQLFRTHLGSEVYSTEVTASPVFECPEVGNVSKSGPIPMLSVLASGSRERGVSLFVINRSQTAPVTAKINLKGFTPKKPPVVKILSGETLSAHNEESSPAVQVKTESFPSASQDFSYVFPKHSLTIFEYKASPQ